MTSFVLGRLRPPPRRQTSRTRIPTQRTGQCLFFVEPGLEITIKGRFPSARYFGIDVYGNDSLSFVRNDVPSTLPDFEIDPDANGTNPWQSDGAGSGDYTISVSNSVMSGQSNVLPLSPSPPPSADDSLIPILPANTGYLMFRVYLPENGDPNDTTYVELPTLTFSIGAVERELAPCSVAQSDAGDFSPSGPLGRLIQDQLSVNEGGALRSRQFLSATSKFFSSRRRNHAVPEWNFWVRCRAVPARPGLCERREGPTCPQAPVRTETLQHRGPRMART